MESITTSTQIWYAFWEMNGKITLQRVFGEGGQNLDKSQAPTPGIVRLQPRRGNYGELVGFEVQAIKGDLKPAWEGISLAPLGTVPPSLDGVKLRKWAADTSHEMEYGGALNALVAELHGDKTNLQRLEGYFPVADPDTGAFIVDRVRIVNLPGAVEDGTDLALIVLTLIGSYGLSKQQNGGGTGPPGPMP
jgi:hypothetical protein